MTDLIGCIGLAITLFALSRNNMTHLRTWSIFGLGFFLTQAIMIDNVSLITTNLTFITLHLTKLYKDKK